MKKTTRQLILFAAILGFSLSFADSVFADAGQGLKDDFKGAIQGSVGTTAGLGISLVGLYMWIWRQASWGVVVALGGALLTAFPGIYSSIGEFGTTAFGNSLGTGAKVTPVDGGGTKQ